MAITGAFAQWTRSDGGGSRPSAFRGGKVDRGNIPSWSVNPQFQHDVFTFARIHYNSSGRERSSYAWFTDFPDADLKSLVSASAAYIPRRLIRSLTFLDITDPELFRFPWLFMSGAGTLF